MIVDLVLLEQVEGFQPGKKRGGGSEIKVHM